MRKISKPDLRFHWLFVLFAAPALVQGALIDRGGGMVYDTDLNITWLADANYAWTSGYSVDGLLTYQESLEWADQLVHGGYDDWRLAQGLPGSSPPYCTGYHCDDTEMSHLYYTELGGTVPRGSVDLTGDHGPFINIYHQYWTGIGISATEALNYHFIDGLQFVHPSDALFAAWAVRDGDVVSTAVPLPAALHLMVGGIAVLLRFARDRTASPY